MIYLFYDTLTSKKNGNSIFLPASGHFYGDRISGEGMLGFYWSSSLGTVGYASSIICFGSDRSKEGSSERFTGLTIRPVCQ